MKMHVPQQSFQEYLQNNKRTCVQMVQTKSRVFPMKKMHIPRVELSDAAIDASLTRTIFEFISVKIPVYY